MFQIALFWACLMIGCLGAWLCHISSLLSIKEDQLAVAESSLQWFRDRIFTTLDAEEQARVWGVEVGEWEESALLGAAGISACDDGSARPRGAWIGDSYSTEISKMLWRLNSAEDEVRIPVPLFDVERWEDGDGYKVIMTWPGANYNLRMDIPVDCENMDLAFQIACGLEYRFRVALGLVPRVKFGG